MKSGNGEASESEGNSWVDGGKVGVGDPAEVGMGGSSTEVSVQVWMMGAGTGGV